jgi:hypothetical protein
MYILCHDRKKKLPCWQVDQVALAASAASAGGSSLVPWMFA